MAEDHNQRLYRSNDPYNRGAPAAPAAAGGGDPLAELARLIGQGDPFAEFGRDGGRRASAPPPQRAAEPPADWTPQQAAQHGYPPPQPAHDPRLAHDPRMAHDPRTAHDPRIDPRMAQAPANYAAPDYYNGGPAAPQPAYEPPHYAAPNQFPAPAYERQPFGAPPFAPAADAYRGGHDEHDYDDRHQPAGYEPERGYGQEPGGYPADPYYQDKMRLPEHDDDLYEDEPAPRRRMGVIAIAGVFALAVVGTAGAFGYRAIFGSGGSNPPPVIKADAGPNKIVPAMSADSQKMIQDRIGGSGQERLVSRQEQPIDMKDRQAGIVLPGQDGGQQPALGSGVVGGAEPKRIRTIAIHPDQGSGAESATPVQVTPNSVRPVAPAPRANEAPIVVPPAQPNASMPPPAPRQVAPRPVVARAAQPAPESQPAPVRRVAAAPAPATENAPLSLSPDAGDAPAPAPARRVSATMRTASASQPVQIAPQAAASGGGGAGSYAVQVSSQRSEAEAQSAFRSLQSKYPTQLGGRSPVIHRVDLGEKGIYYRAMVGPFANSSEAGDVCSSLKAAGGQCIVQKN